MKKILFLIALFILIPKVNASTYYSDYILDDDYTSELITETDLISIDSEQEVYQYYKETIRYEYLDDSNYEKTGNSKEVVTPWIDDISLIDESKPYDIEYKYYHYKTRDYTHLILKNNGNEEKIKSVKIYDMRNNTIVFDKKDVVLSHGNKYIFVIDNLDMYYAKLEIEFEDGLSDINMDLYLSESRDIFIDGQFIQNINEYKICIDDFTKYDISDNNELVMEHSKYLPSNVTNYLTFYRNNYIAYEYKIVEREYIDEYGTLENDEYLLDKDRVKKLYKYKKRDKVVLKDDLSINDKNTKLTDFIEYSSIDLDDIKITSDINYSINGMYQINYILPFKTIKKDIKVDIESNYIDLINKQNEYITDLINSTIESNYAVDKKNLEIKEVIIEDDTKIKELTELLNTCYKEKNDLEDEKEVLKTEKKVKQQSFSYIYIVLLLIVLLITCRIKVLKKNS